MIANANLQSRMIHRWTLAPSIKEIVAHGLLFIGYQLAEETAGADAHAVANVVGPAVMVAFLAIANWQMMRADSRCLWTSLFWFRLSTATYFGVGTIGVSMMSDATRLYIESFYRFTDEDVFKINCIVSLSVTLVLGISRLVVLAWTRNQSSGVSSSDADAQFRQLALVGTFFAVVGFTVLFVIKVPYDLGWTKFEWPGSIVGLSRMSMLGTFMLAVYATERARWMLPVAIGLLILEMLISLLLFTKTGVMMPLVLFCLSILWSRISATRIATCAFLIVALFVSIQPIVSYGREQLDLKYGEGAQPGFAERMEILSSYGGTSSEMVVEEGLERHLIRISYVSSAALIISQFDLGRPASWPDMILAVFVPRFLWPDKPIISNIGVQINMIGRGSETSSTGAGLFADAYWAGGWPGVLVLMSLYGALLGVTTTMTARLFAQGRWIFFPVILLALMQGFRTDGAFITDVFGGSVIMAGMFAVLAVVERLTGLRRGGQTEPPYPPPHSVGPRYDAPPRERGR